MDTAEAQAQVPAPVTIESLLENTGAIDMTPDTTAPKSAGGSTALATVPGTSISPQMRSDTTARHVGDVMESLDFAAVRLEGAMYRIGYLESQVDTMQEQLKVLSEFRQRAAKAILTERENVALQERITEYEEELEETHQILEKLNSSKAWQCFRWLFQIKL